MLLSGDGYHLTKREWDLYHNFKPSFLQIFVHHVLYPMEFMTIYYRYEAIPKEMLKFL